MALLPRRGTRRAHQPDRQGDSHGRASSASSRFANSISHTLSQWTYSPRLTSFYRHGSYGYANIERAWLAAEQRNTAVVRVCRLQLGAC